MCVDEIALRIIDLTAGGRYFLPEPSLRELVEGETLLGMCRSCFAVRSCACRCCVN